MLTVNKVFEQTELSYEKCCHLAELAGFKPPFRPLFYDIETTGLARKTTQLYLIGCVYFENTVCRMIQWIAESPEEEPNVLEAFLRFSADFTHTIQFNGNRFDAPYIRERCSVYGLNSPLDLLPALDLYQFVKPIKLLLQLNHLKQADVEGFLGYFDRIYPDGKACITHYKNYVKEQDENSLAMVLGHNEEDLKGMLRIYPILAYQGLMKHGWSYNHMEQSDGELLFSLTLQDAVPQRITGGIPGLYIRIEEDQIRLLVKIQDGRLQQFYTNYKDYVYLPAEDQAIPKSLGTYIDKNLKQAATLQTCYTWFACSEQFLLSREMQEKYLSHAVSYILEVLCVNK